MTLERKEKIKRISMRALHIFCYVCTGLFFLLLIIGFANSGSKTTKKSEEYQVRNVASEPVKHNLIVDYDNDSLYVQNYNDLVAITNASLNAQNIDFSTMTQGDSLYIGGLADFGYSFTYEI